MSLFFFFFQAEDGIRDLYVTGVQTCALPICHLLVELGLPRHPVVREVAQLVLQPLEPVLDDGVVGDALLQRDHGDVVLGSAARPQDADQGAEAEADGEDQRQGEQQGEGVHGPSMDGPTDSLGQARCPDASVRRSSSAVLRSTPADATSSSSWASVVADASGATTCGCARSQASAMLAAATPWSRAIASTASSRARPSGVRSGRTLAPRARPSVSASVRYFPVRNPPPSAR